MREFDENEIIHEMYLHLLWSTVSQNPLLTSHIAPHLYDCLCNLALNEGCHLIGGHVFCDHIQLVVKFTPDTVLSDLITNLKVASSLWIRTNFSEIENFEWQKSDFGFSVGVDEVEALLKRITKTKLFKDEVFSLLDQSQIEYSPAEVLC